MLHILEEYHVKDIGYQQLDESTLQTLNKNEIHTLDKKESCLITTNYVGNRNSIYLKNCIFKEMDISETHIDKAVFINCMFNDVTVKNTGFSHGIFINCCFISTNFMSVNLDYSNFIGCYFEGTFMYKCKLNYAQFISSNYDDINIDLDNKSPDYSETINLIVDNKEIINNQINTNKKEVIEMDTNNYESKIISNDLFDATYEIDHTKIYSKCVFNKTPMVSLENGPDFKECTFKGIYFPHMYKISFSGSRFESCSFDELVMKCHFDDCLFDDQSHFKDLQYCNFANSQLSEEMLNTLKKQSKDCYFTHNEATNEHTIDEEFNLLIKPLYEKYEEYQQIINRLRNEEKKKPEVKDYINSLSDAEKIEFMSVIFSNFSSQPDL
ncbi:MAG: pentapeptide repeat-containing protein [Erysipelotrichaceae bacterium]|nr:pentapeptide repeat-containing protein [Erysipelotrichaceae bacterium]